jgi:hypothetical protein
MPVRLWQEIQEVLRARVSVKNKRLKREPRPTPPTEVPLDDGAREGTDAWREIGGVRFCHWDRWLLRLALDEPEGLRAPHASSGVEQPHVAAGKWLRAMLAARPSPRAAARLYVSMIKTASEDLAASNRRLARFGDLVLCAHARVGRRQANHSARHRQYHRAAARQHAITRAVRDANLIRRRHVLGARRPDERSGRLRRSARHRAHDRQLRAAARCRSRPMPPTGSGCVGETRPTSSTATQRGSAAGRVRAPKPTRRVASPKPGRSTIGSSALPTR